MSWLFPWFLFAHVLGAIAALEMQPDFKHTAPLAQVPHLVMQQGMGIVQLHQPASAVGLEFAEVSREVRTRRSRQRAEELVAIQVARSNRRQTPLSCGRTRQRV